MFKYTAVVICIANIVLIGLTSWAQEKTHNGIMITRLINQVCYYSCIRNSFRLSPDGNHVACVKKSGNKMTVIIDGKEDSPYDEILSGIPIFSPDSRSVAYAARDGKKWFVVIDGKEGKRYDGLIKNILIFSQDSKHLAYAARFGNAWFMVVDGLEGIEHDNSILIEDDSIVFESVNDLHYLATVGHSIYYVEEKIY